MPHASNNVPDHHDPPLDRRQRRTRAALHDALFALLNERDYAAITVKDIAEQADIARKTFYLHYADKDALLWDSLESLFDDLVAEMGALDAETLLADGKPLSYPLFAHVRAHAPVYRALLGEHGPARRPSCRACWPISPAPRMRNTPRCGRWRSRSAWTRSSPPAS